jgi:hypothetical protein
MRQDTRYLILALRESAKVMGEPSEPKDVVQHPGFSRCEIARQLRHMRSAFGRQCAKDMVIAVAKRSFGYPAPIERSRLPGC